MENGTDRMRKREILCKRNEIEQCVALTLLRIMVINTQEMKYKNIAHVHLRNDVTHLELVLTKQPTEV